MAKIFSPTTSASKSHEMLEAVKYAMGKWFDDLLHEEKKYPFAPFSGGIELELMERCDVWIEDRWFHATVIKLGGSKVSKKDLKGWEASTKLPLNLSALIMEYLDSRVGLHVNGKPILWRDAHDGTIAPFDSRVGIHRKTEAETETETERVSARARVALQMEKFIIDYMEALP